MCEEGEGHSALYSYVCCCNLTADAEESFVVVLQFTVLYELTLCTRTRRPS